MAVSRDEITTLVNEYLSNWSASDLAQLPTSSRLTHVGRSEDIGYWALVLTRSKPEFRGSTAQLTLLEELLSVFETAASRVAQLSDRVRSGD